MDLENGAFYWAITYGKLTVIEHEAGGQYWLTGDDSSRYYPNGDIKIIAKITPPSSEQMLASIR